MGVPRLKDSVYLFSQTIGNNLWQQLPDWLGSLCRSWSWSRSRRRSQRRSQSHNAQTGMTMWQPWRYRDLCFYELFVKLAARAHVRDY